MNKISRYILVLIGIIAGAIILPRMYWLSFEKPIRSPFILYSSVDRDFLITRSNDGLMRTDTKGNEYTREEFEQKAPLFYLRQLLISGTMPDSIDGKYMDVSEINHNRSTFRLKPKDMDMPQPGLYPLFESESGRANLEMPKDFFRITWRMDFIDAASNKVNEEKSRMFSAVLQKRGFEFPAQIIAGIPTTRKSCDEGYLVTDSKDDLFHIKMMEGRPYVKAVDLPDTLTFKHIACVDFSNKEFYAYMISGENDLYILGQDTYELAKLNISGYIPEKEELRIYGNLFYYTCIRRGNSYVKVSVLDRDLKKVDEYQETWTPREERTEGRIFARIFPAEISLTESNSEFINFYFIPTKGMYWLLLNFLLMGIYVHIIRHKKLKLKNNILDLILIAVSGIFGFIAVNLFQNKFFD